MGISSIPHIYEDKELTYEDVVDILTKAANGQIKGTEKTDGLNIFLGYKDGQPKAARNITEIKNGGLDGAEFAEREFQADQHIKEVFNAAFNAYSNIIKRLDNEQIKILFGADGNTFLNCEILSGRTNLVTYSTKIILIHRTGHKEFNPATQKVESVREDRAKAIAIMIDNLNDALEQMLDHTEFKLQQDKIEHLPALEDQSTLANTTQKLQQAGFKEGMSIGDYIFEAVKIKVKESLPVLNDTTTAEVAKKIAGVNGANSISILKSYVDQNPKFVQDLQNLVRRSKEIVDEVLFPIEDAIHDFTVEVLAKLESQFIDQKEESTEDIKQRVKEKVLQLQNYNGPDKEAVHNRLKKHLLKLKHIDKISNPTEGFVFNYKGKTYKFTGNFAPVNQILNISPQQEKSQIAESHKPVALFPGSFRPPHKGHLELIKKALPKYSKVVVLVSKPEKNMRSDISAEQSKQIFDEYTKGLPVETRVCNNNSPYVEAAEMIKNREGNVVLTSDKEPTKFDKFNFPKDVLHADFDMSAGQMRDIISSDKTNEEKKAELLGYLPQNIDSNTIFSILLNSNPVSLQEIFSILDTMPTNESKDNNINKFGYNEIFDILDEMSAMGGAVGSSGDVEMSPILSSKPQRKKKKTRTYTLEEILDMSNNYLKESTNE